MSWIIFPFLAMIFYSLGNVLIKATGEAYYEIFFVQSFFYMILASSLIFLYEFNIKSKNMPFLIGIGIFFSLAALFTTLGIKKSPNPGIAIAIVNLNTLLTFLLASLILKAPYNIYHLIGVLMATVAAVLLVL